VGEPGRCGLCPDTVSGHRRRRPAWSRALRLEHCAPLGHGAAAVAPTREATRGRRCPEGARPGVPREIRDV